MKRVLISLVCALLAIIGAVYCYLQADWIQSQSNYYAEVSTLWYMGAGFWVFVSVVAVFATKSLRAARGIAGALVLVVSTLFLVFSLFVAWISMPNCGPWPAGDKYSDCIGGASAGSLMPVLLSFAGLALGWLLARPFLTEPDK